MNKHITWDNKAPKEAVAILDNNGIIVSPTKVGYIIMTTNRQGLERKFHAKKRNLNKPGVVLCGSLEQLQELAEMTEEILAFYQSHQDSDILLGCILPWKEEGIKYIPDDSSDELMMDKRKTSCFVIRFGTPSEQIVRKLWDDSRTLVFASSANPSGKGNKGVIEGIGDDIFREVDLLIEANDYVDSIQPKAKNAPRHEQGVMVSMVDDDGALIPEQHGKRGVLPAPTIIRKGLDVDIIMSKLSAHFNTWDYRQGFYY